MSEDRDARLWVSDDIRERVNDRKRGDETQNDVIERLLNATQDKDVVPVGEGDAVGAATGPQPDTDLCERLDRLQEEVEKTPERTADELEGRLR